MREALLQLDQPGMIARHAETRRQDGHVAELRKGPPLPAGLAGSEDPWWNLVHGDVVAAQLARQVADVADLRHHAGRATRAGSVRLNCCEYPVRRLVSKNVTAWFAVWRSGTAPKESSRTPDFERPERQAAAHRIRDAERVVLQHQRGGPLEAERGHVGHGAVERMRVEDAEAAAQHRLLDAEGPPGEAEARPEVVPVRVEHLRAVAVDAGELHHPGTAGNRVDGVLVEPVQPVVQVFERRVGLPPHAEVEVRPSRTVQSSWKKPPR